MMQLTPGAFELVVDKVSPRPYRGVGVACEIVNSLVREWLRDGYSISANDGIARSDEEDILYSIGRQPVDHLDAVRGEKIVGGVDLDWSAACDVLTNLSDSMEIDSHASKNYAWSLFQSEMTDA